MAGQIGSAALSTLSSIPGLSNIINAVKNYEIEKFVSHYCNVIFSGKFSHGIENLLGSTIRKRIDNLFVYFDIRGWL
mgnify:CR=1 FL=1